MPETALYIHIPWCIRKCPYCDFNSHKSPEILPEEQYVDALIADFSQDLQNRSKPTITTIFIGGGTPSLFSAAAYVRLLRELRQLADIQPDAEITLEANPGTVEQQRFEQYREAGINRLSLGIQSFNPRHLKALGRIHDDQQANRAIEMARLAGFDNINLDIMHGLPEQSVAEGLSDIRQALSWNPEHLSWYQLTLEPNTVFYKQRPRLPGEEDNEALETAGLALLADNQYERYEISAFAKTGKAAQHNMNYWLFGDYYGLGAGAHGKLSLENEQIYRTSKHRQPADYLRGDRPFLVQKKILDEDALIFEFMLNASRLEQPVPKALFQQRTGLAFELLQPGIDKAVAKGMINLSEKYWQITPLGRRFTNNVQELFLPD